MSTAHVHGAIEIIVGTKTTDPALLIYIIYRPLIADLSENSRIRRPTLWLPYWPAGTTVFHPVGYNDSAEMSVEMTRGADRVLHDGATLLHTSGDVETELVSAGLRLRRRAAREEREIDDEALIDLCGVVKVSEVNLHRISVLNFDGFAPAARWEEVSVFTNDPRGSEVSQ